MNSQFAHEFRVFLAPIIEMFELQTLIWYLFW